MREGMWHGRARQDCKSKCHLVSQEGGDKDTGVRQWEPCGTHKRERRGLRPLQSLERARGGALERPV